MRPSPASLGATATVTQTTAVTMTTQRKLDLNGGGQAVSVVGLACGEGLDDGGVSGGIGGAGTDAGQAAHRALPGTELREALFRKAKAGSEERQGGKTLKPRVDGEVDETRQLTYQDRCKENKHSAKCAGKCICAHLCNCMYECM